MTERAASISQIKTALPPAYMAKRPSFRRCAARVLRVLDIELERADYEAVANDIRTLDHLLGSAHVDLAKDRVTSYTVNTWAGNHQVKARLEPRKAPSPYENLRPPEPLKLRARAVKAPGRGVTHLCVPDVHFGFRNAESETLETIHDELAVAVTVEIARRAQPTTIVVLGDLLDLASFGRFPTEPALRNLTQPAIQAAYAFLVDLRNAAPEAEIVYLEGNHEARIAKLLNTDRNEAVSLRRAGDDERHNVLSIPHLLRLDELRIAYIGPYGRAHYHDGIRFIHGELVGSRGGDTVAKLLRERPDISTVCGHVHRLELAHRRQPIDAASSGQQWAMSCGTLARIDGAVPGSHAPDWHQGLGLIRSGRRPQTVTITDGAAMFDGALIEVTP